MAPSYGALNRNTQAVEHPGRYAVLGEISTLQRNKRDPGGEPTEQGALKRAKKGRIGREARQALVEAHSRERVNAVLIGELPRADSAGAQPLILSSRRHEDMITEHMFSQQERATP